MSKIEIDKRDILLTLLLALAYFAFGKLSFVFALQNAIVTIAIFAAEGIALAAALLFGRRALVGIFLGQFALALSEELGIFVAAGIALVNTFEALIAVRIQERVKLDISFGSITSVLSVFALTAFVLQPFSAVFGNLFLYLGNIVAFGELPSSLFSWWFGNVMGQILVTPALILLYSEYKKQGLEIDKLVMTLLFFFFVVVLFTSVLPIENMALLIGITLPLVMITGFRIGEVYGAAAIILIAYILLYCTHVGIGPFTNAQPVDNIININFYILVHVLVYYTTLGLYREKKKALSQLHTLNAGLEQSMREQLRELAKEEREVLPSLLAIHTRGTMGVLACQWRQSSIGLKRQLHTFKESLRDDRTSMDRFEQFAEMIDANLKKTASFEKLFEENRQKRLFSVGEIVKDAMNVTLPNLRSAQISLQIDIDQNHILKGYPDELTQILFFLVRYIKEAYLHDDTVKKHFIKIKVDTSFVNDLGLRLETALRMETLPEDSVLWEEHPKNALMLELYTLKMIMKHYLQGDLQIENDMQGSSLVLLIPKS